MARSKALTPESLAGGDLARVMSLRMLANEKLRARFAAKVRKPDDKVLAICERTFGWRPAAELAEWEGVEAAYRACANDVSDVWMLGVFSGFAPKIDLAKVVNDAGFILLATTGLAHFGDDPSGDSCYVHTLPHPAGYAGVHVFNHENGELEGSDYASIAQLVYECWHPDPHPDDEGEGSDALVKTFERNAAKATKQRPAFHDPHRLFDRMKWLWTFPCGEPGFRYAEDMTRAPDFATWEKERSLLAREPVLANYWLLAHWFLGNDEAAREAVTLANKAPGTITPALARAIAALLDGEPQARLGKVDAKALAELRAAIRKNADPALLEPSQRASVEKTRAGAGKKAGPKELAARLAAGEDPFRLVAEFPDDVAAHDVILTRLALDAKWKATVAAYQKTRASTDAFHEWPNRWQKDKPDARLSPIVGAAFRAGLRYDADHPKAASSLANTLAFFDDDTAMASFGAAIETLRQDDDRLEFVVAALLASKHPRAREIVVRAAWRFFEVFDATLASMQKAAKRGPTLNDVFRVDNQILPALQSALRAGDDTAVALADKVLSYRQGLQVMGAAVGDAFQVAGEKKLDRHLPMVRAYLTAVGRMTDTLNDADHCNYAEAALALARLAPDTAVTELSAITAQDRESKGLTQDLIGGALAGLLALSPHDPMLLAQTERILGNRTQRRHVYGALRGVGVGHVEAAREWVRYHLYAGCSSNHLGEFWPTLRAARDALVALGEAQPPPFDESDEFASRVEPKDLPAALLQPGRYHTDHVFKHIREKKVRDPRVIEIGGPLLADRFRFSADDGERSRGCDERKEGVKTLVWLGAAALPALGPLLSLPHMAVGHRNATLAAMHGASDPVALWRRLATATREEVSGLLTERPWDTMALSDLVAGWAFVRWGNEARGAIEDALRWRVELQALEKEEFDGSDGQEPLTFRLPYLFRQLPGTSADLEALRQRVRGHASARDWERALKVSLPKPEGMAGEAARTLALVLDGGDWPRHVCAISVEKKKVSVSYACENFHGGLVDGGRYERKGTIPCASPEAATTLADTIARSLEVLGFRGPSITTAAKAASASATATSTKAAGAKGTRKPRPAASKGRAGRR
jgi:hypothetical protein